MGVRSEAARDGSPVARRLIANMSRYVPGARFLGSAFWVAWILLIYSTELFSDTYDVHTYNALCYFVSTFSIAATYIALASIGPRGFRFVGSRRAALATGALAAAGTVLIVAGAHRDMPGSLVCCVAGNLMTGFGTGCLSMRCAGLYGELSARRSFVMTFCMMAVGMLVYAAALTFVRPALVATTALLPLAAAFMTLVDDAPDSSARSEGTRALGPAFWRFAAIVFLLSFAFTISRGLYPNALPLGQFNESRGFVALAILVVCAVMVVVSSALPDRYGFGKVTYWVVAASAVVLFFVPLTGVYSASVGVALSTAFILLGAVAWALLGGIASITGLSALRVFGFGFAGYLLGSMLGWPLGQLLDNLDVLKGQHWVEVVFAAAVLVLLFVLLRKDAMDRLLSPREDGQAGPAGAGEDGGVDAAGEGAGVPEGPAGAGDAPNEGAAAGADDDMRKLRWRVVVEQMAQEHGLTMREAEVLLLMSKGRNARGIADELDISYNTARTHVRNIYTKLDVHSQNALVNTVESRRASWRDE